MIHEFCASSKLRMIKTIRNTGRVREGLLPLLRDGIKYIHLIRHPRDVAKSYERFIAQNRWLKGSGDTNAAKEARLVSVCTRMKSEADFFARVEARNPGSVERVRY